MADRQPWHPMAFDEAIDISARGHFGLFLCEERERPARPNSASAIAMPLIAVAAIVTVKIRSVKRELQD